MIVVVVVVVAVAWSADDEGARPVGDPDGEGEPVSISTGADPIAPGARGGPGETPEDHTRGGAAAGSATGEPIATRGGDAGISPGRGPTPPVAIELGATGTATSGARLGQARYLLDQQRERLPRIEQAIADAEREGDTERLRIERERLAIARSRIAELEAHATDLEAAAREDGTLADADREGPRPVGVGTRPGQTEAP